MESNKHLYRVAHMSLLAVSAVVTGISVFRAELIAGSPVSWAFVPPLYGSDFVGRGLENVGVPLIVIQGIMFVLIVYAWYSLLTLVASLKLKLSWFSRCFCWTGVVALWIVPIFGALVFGYE
jgi:hypothetical protein